MDGNKIIHIPVLDNSIFVKIYAYCVDLTCCE
jgi:hypothetical protein